MGMAKKRTAKPRKTQKKLPKKKAVKQQPEECLEMPSISGDEIVKTTEMLQKYEHTLPPELVENIRKSLNISSVFYLQLQDCHTRSAKLKLLVELGLVPKSERSRNIRMRSRAEGADKTPKGPNEDKYKKSLERDAERKKQATKEQKTPNKTPAKLCNLQVEHKKELIKAPRPLVEGERIEIQPSITYGIKTVITRTEVSKEVIRDAVTGEVEPPCDTVTPAPKGFNHSYDLIETVAYLHCMMMLPFHRLSKYLSNPIKNFSRSQLYNLFHFQAEAFLSVYLHLSEVLTTEAETIQLDDTKILTLQAEENYYKSRQGKPPDKAPVEDPSQSDDEDSLDVLVCSLVNEHSYTLQDPTKLKQYSHSCLTGVVNNGHRVVFHRSHHGSAGNLLSSLLETYGEYREQKSLFILGDLSAGNKVKVQGKLNSTIQYAGCTAHARRAPFKHRNDHDELYGFLRCFKIMAFAENQIKKHIGQNNYDEKALYYRAKYSQKAWEILLNRAKTAMANEPQSSNLYKSAKYIVNGYDKLTLYLKHPSMPADNNLVERLLRDEKLIQNNSKFRVSYEGRTALDIIRTVYVTAKENNVDFRKYAIALLRNREAAKKDPAAWLPWEWQNRQNENDC